MTKVLIDIPDYNLDEVQNGSIACGMILNAVKNGIVIPKGYGDLISRNALTKIIEREIYYAENPTIHRTLNYCLGVIDNAPAIIKGDKEAENGKP